MTPEDAWSILNRHNFTKEDNIRTPGRFIESMDLHWVSYSNPTKGHKTCIFAGKPFWSDWQPVWEDSFHIAFAKYLEG